MQIQLREFKELRDELVRLKRDQQQIIEAIVREVSLTLYREIKEITPVISGYLNENWVISSVQNVGQQYIVTISNAAEYAEFVEYGHRIVRDGVTVGWADGRLMMTISERKIKRELDSMVQRILRREQQRRRNL